MGRPLKYLPGARIETIGEFADEIAAGRYVIEFHSAKAPPEGSQGRRVHPGWAGSWQFNMVRAAIRRGCLYRALPNPDHPDNLAPRG